MNDYRNSEDFIAKFYPDLLQRPNARWRTALRIAANHEFSPEFRESYVTNILCTPQKPHPWQKEDMEELSLTIIECATEEPLPLNAGDCYAGLMKMICDSYSRHFNDAMKNDFIACFHRVLYGVFMFYWGNDLTRFPFAVGSPESTEILVKRAQALCDFIAALNPRHIVSHADIARCFKILYHNRDGITVHHLRAVDIMIGTAGSYLWLDPPNPMGNVEGFMRYFKPALANCVSEWNDDLSLPKGLKNSQDYGEYIADKAKRFAAYHAEKPPVLFHLRRLLVGSPTA